MALLAAVQECAFGISFYPAANLQNKLDNKKGFVQQKE
jgi:hypothetical protein